ncbi:uncharacterized protein [Aegilops tauschii subsp. strangulata]|uniref:uncharacterized protein n=1 Tax=Aegilops tauschii subsp. strangulata TaxID=200361 RepID=UPI001ABBEDB5
MVMESEPQPSNNGHEPQNTTTTITYQAGLAPPGGLWPDSQQGHLASYIVMLHSYVKRYKFFFYCNAIAFMASLIVPILLLVRELSRNAIWLRSLQFAMLVNLLGLMGAYAAGSCREVRTSVYIWVLLAGIFTYVALHVVFFRHLAPEWLRDIFRNIQRFWEDSIAQVFSRRHLWPATLAATVTYTAGLSPPGGFWPDNNGSHIAGDPVLQDHYPRRFKAFMACNSTAFSGSLVIIIMLLSKAGVNHISKSNVLRLWVLISLLGLMAAYAAGSCREVRTSIFVFSLVGAFRLYLIIQWVAPMVPKPGFIREWIKWMEGEQNKLMLKVNSFMDSCSRSSGQVTPLDNVKDDLGKLRTYLLLLGILAVTITYQAGLHPPGGFWPDSRDEHLAGDPILEAIHPMWYKTFFYCNATAFVASLVIITLLQSQLITIGAMRRYVLQTAMVFDLFSIMGAYAAGSSRALSTSIYVIILVILVFSYVVLHSVLFVDARVPDESAQQQDDNPEVKDLEKRRKFLMMLAILAESSTYQAGISPPGGFWADNRDSHEAGHPLFSDEFPRRYQAFIYLNSTAFMASLAVIMLLISRRLCHKGLQGYTLRACVLLDLISLMGAFATGSCRKVSVSVYVILVLAAVFACIMILVLVLTFAKDKVINFFNWMFHITAFKRPNPPKNHDRSIKVNKKTSQKWRKDLMLIGTFTVSVTYQAGLLPPGALWPDDRDGHFTGDPVIHDTHPIRYKVFFYCNATAFMASMVIVIMLLNSTISKYKRSLLAMKTAMVMDLLGLLGAYAAGSCRNLKTSAYIFALVIAVFIYIVIHIFLSFDKMARLVRTMGEQWMPCLTKIWVLIEIEPSNHDPSTEQP